MGKGKRGRVEGMLARQECEKEGVVANEGEWKRENRGNGQK